MAANAPSRPGRTLLVMLLLLVGLLAWAFWPGTSSTPRLGLDLQGGTQVILTPKPVTEGASITEEQLNQTVEIIRQRVNGIGAGDIKLTPGDGQNMDTAAAQLGGQLKPQLAARA